MEEREKAKRYEPEIVENYHDFAPPLQIRGMLSDLLEAVPPKYLVGLRTIILTNKSALDRKRRRQKIWGRIRQYQLADSLDLYYAATRSSPATVWLNVDNILAARPSWVLRVPVLNYMGLGNTLYHEIGHHIHAVHRPEYEGKENVAEDWGKKLFQQFVRRRYWYLIPILVPLARLLKWMRPLWDKQKTSPPRP